MSRLLILLVPFTLLAMGCARNSDGTWKAPLVYRIDVQQGNVVDQAMIDKLRPGMDKKQVKFIMGTPLIVDTFHGDRWDYVYSYEPGGGQREQRHVALYFKNEKLARVDGDIKISDKPRVDDETKAQRTVEVPLESDKPGIFNRMFSKNKDKKNTAAGEENSNTPTTEAPAAGGATINETGVDTTATTTEAAGTEIPEQKSGDTTKVDESTKTDGATKITNTVPDSKATTNAKATTGEESTAGNTQEKNLLRRFWDRMTKSSIDTDVDAEESEQAHRDAEVLKGTGGDINK